MLPLGEEIDIFVLKQYNNDPNKKTKENRDDQGSCI